MLCSRSCRHRIYLPLLIVFAIPPTLPLSSSPSTPFLILPCRHCFCPHNLLLPVPGFCLSPSPCLLFAAIFYSTPQSRLCLAYIGPSPPPPPYSPPLAGSNGSRAPQSLWQSHHCLVFLMAWLQAAGQSACWSPHHSF